jgi:hypothetical protein
MTGDAQAADDNGQSGGRHALPPADGGAIAAATAPESGTPEKADDDTAVPDDFFVTLQPLTLELVAHQLRRMDIRFTDENGTLSASWKDFVMTTRVLPDDLLSVRVLLSTGYPSEMITAVVARCNWWNQTRTFLKASARVGLFRVPQPEGMPSPETDVQRQQATIVNLDMDLPCPVGIAPVQIQALVRALLSNVKGFQADARLDVLRLDSGWR